MFQNISGVNWAADFFFFSSFSQMHIHWTSFSPGTRCLNSNLWLSGISQTSPVSSLKSNVEFRSYIFYPKCEVKCSVWLFDTIGIASLPGSSVHGIRQAGILLPFPSPGDLLHSRMKPGSSTLQADSLPSEPPGKPFLIIFGLEVNSIKFYILSVHINATYISFPWINSGKIERRKGGKVYRKPSKVFPFFVCVWMCVCEGRERLI